MNTPLSEKDLREKFEQHFPIVYTDKAEDWTQANIQDDIFSFFLKDRENLLLGIREDATELRKSIIRADKTPRYSYSGKGARNANGEAPDGGRWKNSWELVESFIYRLEALSKQSD